MDSLECYLDQQPGLANPMTLKVGDVVGDWRIRALIGRGGNSEVYRVEHVRNGDFAALKFLLPAKDTAAEERRRQRFLQEAGATKVFRHPVLLASNRTYRITGPGTLDADISGPTNSLLVLKNCVLINRTTQTYPKNGVRYQLDNGVYLNFINQKERLGQSRRFVLPYDGAYNEVRFGGPATLKAFDRFRNVEGMNRIRRE